MGRWRRVVASVLVVAASSIAAPPASAQTGGQITGIVTDAATGSPLGGFEVQLFTADGTPLTSFVLDYAGYSAFVWGVGTDVPILGRR